MIESLKIPFYPKILDTMSNLDELSLELCPMPEGWILESGTFNGKHWSTKTIQHQSEDIFPKSLKNIHIDIPPGTNGHFSLFGFIENSHDRIPFRHEIVIEDVVDEWGILGQWIGELPLRIQIIFSENVETKSSSGKWINEKMLVVDRGDFNNDHEFKYAINHLKLESNTSQPVNFIAIIQDEYQTFSPIQGMISTNQIRIPEMGEELMIQFTPSLSSSLAQGGTYDPINGIWFGKRKEWAIDQFPEKCISIEWSISEGEQSIAQGIVYNPEKNYTSYTSLPSSTQAIQPTSIWKDHPAPTGWKWIDNMLCPTEQSSIKEIPTCWLKDANRIDEIHGTQTIYSYKGTPWNVEKIIDFSLSFLNQEESHRNIVEIDNSEKDHLYFSQSIEKKEHLINIDQLLQQQDVDSSSTSPSLQIFENVPSSYLSSVPIAEKDVVLMILNTPEENLSQSIHTMDHDQSYT